MPDLATKAVFLSYASQDEDVARQLCEALRAAGLEVWFDQSELRGGEAWDASIRRQIRDCALFVPLLSASTQQRREGYFRLEWSLADERSRLIAEGTPFILPVVVDATKERDALVPKSFLNVQWTWLPTGGVPPAFVMRVQKLLGVGEPAVAGDANRPSFNVPRRAAPPHASFMRLLPWALTILLAGFLTWMIARPSSRSEPAATASSRPVSHAIIQLPENAPLAPPQVLPLGIDSPALALSPDGTLLVYVALFGKTTQLYLRPLDQPDARPLPDTEGGHLPFFSPDSRWIGFFAKDKLKKISVLGGEAITLSDSGNEVRAGSWGDDNMIYFAALEGVSRISAAKGAAELLKDDQGGLKMDRPNILPGSKRLQGSNGHYMSLTISGDYRSIDMFSLATKQRASLIDRGYNARWLAPGHLVFARGSGLFAAPFDSEQAAVTGEPVPVLNGILLNPLHHTAQFAVSANGTLVYAAGGSQARSTPVWVERDGTHRKLPIEVQTYGHFCLSPDGRRIAIVVPGVPDNLWLFDVETGKGTPLTEPGLNRNPVWTPDGKRLFFSSVRGSKSAVYGKATDGSQQAADLLYEGEGPDSTAYPEACSPDGRRLLINVFSRMGLGRELVSVALDGSRKVERIDSLKGIWFIRFSPDGGWITFTSDKSRGRSEVFVQPFPDGNRTQISFDGGEEPLWSPKGDEIIYRNGDSWTAVSVSLQPTFKPGESKELFRGPFINVPGYSEDIAPDGQRFLMLMPEHPGAPVTQLHVIVNWSEEVRRRVPVTAAKGK